MVERVAVADVAVGDHEAVRSDVHALDAVEPRVAWLRRVDPTGRTVAGDRRHGAARDPADPIVGAIRDGPRMLDAVAILKPDIVVMDISMPEMSGLELARLMQENPPAPPVVFVTVHEDTEFMEAAQAVGAAAYVVKSTMETELKPALELALKGQRFVVPTS